MHLPTSEGLRTLFILSDAMCLALGYLVAATLAPGL